MEKHFDEVASIDSTLDGTASQGADSVRVAARDELLAKENAERESLSAATPIADTAEAHSESHGSMDATTRDVLFAQYDGEDEETVVLRRWSVRELLDAAFAA